MRYKQLIFLYLIAIFIISIKNYHLERINYYNTSNLNLQTINYLPIFFSTKAYLYLFVQILYVQSGLYYSIIQNNHTCERYISADSCKR